MRPFSIPLVVLIVSFVVHFPVRAAESESAAGVMSSDQLRSAGYMPLVESNSMDAWELQPWHKGHWTIGDGVVKYDGQGEAKSFEQNDLWTKQPYSNLEMYGEWRLPSTPTMKPHPIVLYNGDFLMDANNKRVTRPHLDAGDSGFLFRGTSKAQANLWSQELGSGEINGYRTDKSMPPTTRRACIPIKNADRPLGQWNAMHVTLQGNKMSVDNNGERVINEAELPGLPKSGPIGLQHHGDPVEFRQLWIKDLDKSK